MVISSSTVNALGGPGLSAKATLPTALWPMEVGLTGIFAEALLMVSSLLLTVSTASAPSPRELADAK